VWGKREEERGLKTTADILPPMKQGSKEVGLTSSEGKGLAVKRDGRKMKLQGNSQSQK